MTRIDDIIGKRMTVVLWAKNDDGEDEAAFFSGEVLEGFENPFVDRGPDQRPFEIAPSWIERIHEPSDDVKSMFPGSDYILHVGVGRLPDSVDTSELDDTGLQWPKDE